MFVTKYQTKVVQVKRNAMCLLHSFAETNNSEKNDETERLIGVK